MSNSYRLSMGDCQGLGEGGNVELLLNRYRISLWEVKIVLEREHSDINCSNFFFFFFLALSPEAKEIKVKMNT